MKASTFSGFRSIDHGVSRFALCFLLLLMLPSIATAQTGPSRDSPDGSSFGPIVSRKTATSFIILVSVFFFIGLFTVYARHCIGNRRRAGGLSVDVEAAGDWNTIHSRGLDKAVISSFPTVSYSSVKPFKIGKRSLECAVCLDEFADDEILRLLPKCSHVYHCNCIDTWLTSHSTCPLCRENPLPVTTAGYLSLSPSAHSDHDPGPGGAGDRSLQNESDNRAAIENTNPNLTISDLTPLPLRPVRSRSTGWRFNEIFLRSHSANHSLVQPIENNERFTLWLPEEVRRQLLNSTVSLNRARSLGGLQSAREGPRTGNNQIDQWRFFPEKGSGMIQNSEIKVNEHVGGPAMCNHEVR